MIVLSKRVISTVATWRQNKIEILKFISAFFHCLANSLLNSIQFSEATMEDIQSSYDN